MVPLVPPLRLGLPEDGPVLAVLINEAAHGIALYAWTEMAGPGVDPWAIGAERQAARAREGLWVVADEGAGPVAALLALPPAAADDEVPPIFRPLVELEARFPDALYINVLATLEEARGRGHGLRLLRLAEDMARAEGRPRLTLIVADSNTGARRLYDRAGYRVVDERPMVKNGWRGEGERWLLMLKELG